MNYRYSYVKSRMQPPLWIIKDGIRHMAEVWDEDDAQRIVRALEELELPTMAATLRQSE
jgi:hypothetical protein